jgi:hypothetical protein
MKVETYIIDSMPSSSAGRAVILVIMDVETLKLTFLISSFFILVTFLDHVMLIYNHHSLFFYHVHVMRVCAQLCDHQCLRFTFLSMDDE